jgi:hypothetical protein
MIKYCNQWAIDNSGQMKRFPKYTNAILNSDLGLFSAVTYPTADWHRIEKLIKWSLIFFICDDYHGITLSGPKEFCCEPFWDQLNDAMNSFVAQEYYTCNDWPDFVKAVQQICREIYFDYSPEQIRRSTEMIKNYSEGNVSESKWDSKSCQSIDWDNYLNARLGSVGGLMALQFIEYAKNIEISDEEWNHPLIKALNRCVSEEVILINDFYTFRKEVKENDNDFNRMKHPFALLVNNEGLSLQESVNRVHEMILEKDKQIFNHFKTISESDFLRSRTIDLYLEGVSEFLGGYWRHAVTARRYHGWNFKGVLPLEGKFIYDSNQTIIIPSGGKKFKFDWFKPIPKNFQPRN